METTRLFGNKLIENKKCNAKIFVNRFLSKKTEGIIGKKYGRVLRLLSDFKY